jgi:hypothetical protein
MSSSSSASSSVAASTAATTTSTPSNITYELVIESNDSNAHDLAVPTPPPVTRHESAVRSTPNVAAAVSNTTRTLHATRVLGLPTRLSPAPTRTLLIRSDESAELTNTAVSMETVSAGAANRHTITHSSSSSSMTGSGVSLFDDSDDAAKQQVVVSSSIAASSSSSSSSSIVHQQQQQQQQQSQQPVPTTDVPFVAGNPSIQLTRGVIHVFKRTMGNSGRTCIEHCRFQ